MVLNLSFLCVVGTKRVFNSEDIVLSCIVLSQLVLSDLVLTDLVLIDIPYQPWSLCNIDLCSLQRARGAAHAARGALELRPRAAASRAPSIPAPLSLRMFEGVVVMYV